MRELAGFKPPHGVISVFVDLDPANRSDAWRIRLRDAICDHPTVKVSTRGVKTRRNKKATTTVSLRSARSCSGIKSFGVLFPRGSKVNSKLLKYNKKKKATKKNLKNITGKAGSKRLYVNDFKKYGRTGIKIKTRLPSKTHSISLKSSKSTVLLPYKSFCGAIKGNGRTKRAKLKKCKNKLVSFTFVITRQDGSVLRYVYKVKAGSRSFR